MSPEGPFVLAQGEFSNLQDMQRHLRRHGFSSEIVRPPKEQVAAPVFWLLVANEEAQAAAGVLREIWAQDIAPEALAAAQGTVDLDAEQASCPACGASFAPAEAKCPECGLRFG